MKSCNNWNWKESLIKIQIDVVIKKNALKTSNTVLEF